MTATTMTTDQTSSPTYSPERLIKLTAIEANPEQPRKHFDPAALEELAASIRQHGLLQAIVVRNTGRQTYQIIAGERRFRACQIVGLERVPCRVIASISDEEAFILSVTENVARRDMTVIEEGQAYAQIIGLGRSIDDVAAMFGKKDWYVQWRLDLLNLREDLQDLVARGQLNMNLARQLSRLSLNGQANVMARYNAGQFATAELAARYAGVIIAQEAQTDLFLAPVVGDVFADVARTANREKLTDAWAKLGTGTLAKTLDAFLEMSAAEMAAALGPDAAVYGDRFEVLGKALGKVRATMAQAQAIHQATIDAATSAA